MADFYYRYNNGGDALLLNDAYMGQNIPVTSGLYRRFKAEDFAENVWKDSVTGTTITSTNMTLVSHSGDKQYRTTKAVEFRTNGTVAFGNELFPNYTLFFITRYTGGTKARIINGTSQNWLSGHWSGRSGLCHHNAFLTAEPQNDLHGNNFFISRDTGTTYFTNGTNRTASTPPWTSLVGLQINTGSENSDGQILDLIIYNRELTDIEKKKVEHYLASYYGILDKTNSACLTAYYSRVPTSIETSLLVSTTTSPNSIVYPSFQIAQTGLTIAMWFKMSGKQPNARLIDFGTGQGVNNIIIASMPSGGLSLGLYSPAVQFGGNGELTPDYTDNVWRHLVWTISADGLVWKLYINKVLIQTINSSNYSTFGGSIAPYHPTTVLRTSNYIGLDNFGGASKLNGSIEDFQMYNYPLDQTAINQTWPMESSFAVDTVSFLPKYARVPLTTETSMLVSTTTNPNYIIYPAFISAPTGFTFAMWFKANSTPSWTRLFDFGNGAAAYNIISAIKDGNLAISVQNSINSVMTKSEFWNVYPSCNDNVWRHFIWTISANGLTWKVYINKVLQATITSSTMSQYMPTTAGSVDPYHPESVMRATNYIAKSSFGDPAFNGSIHAFQMWNKPLSAASIQSLYTETAFNGQYNLTNFPDMERPISLGSFTLVNPMSTGTGSFSFTSSNTAVATIVDNVVTLKSIGITSIKATQWSTSITSTLTVGAKAAPVLTSFVVPMVAVGYPPFTLTSPTSLSTGGFSYTSSDTTVASISGSTVTVLKSGTTLITATQSTDTNYNSASITTLLTVSPSSISDFYYRYNRSYSKWILNDATSTNPVPYGLHRRFNASDFNPVTKVWTDSANGNTITATGNVSLVTKIGDSQYRPMSVVEFDTTGSFDFNNGLLSNYTLFYITRYKGGANARILNGKLINWVAGHYAGYSGVEYHEKWLLNPNPQLAGTPAMNLHGTNFFIGSSVSTDFYTNGTKRTTETNTTNMTTYLPTLCINRGQYTSIETNSEASNGQILDILMYNRVLSDTERKKVENYLAAYYGILDDSGVLTAKYNRLPLSTEKSLLVSSTISPNWIVYPAFTLAQTGLSFSMWFRSDETATWGRLFDFGNGPGVNNIILANNQNNLSIGTYDTGIVCQLTNVYSNSNQGINDNVWRHLVWTISADGLSWNIYINKVLQANITSSNYTNYGSMGSRGPFHPSSVTRTSNYIGKSNWSDPQFIGAIDEFQMFNYALDQSAISAMYQVNTTTSLSVNLDEGTCQVPMAGTSFVSSDPMVATVSGTTLTFLSSGVTTITSNLHLSQNPVQLVLTVIKKGIGFISGTKDILEEIDKTSIQTLTVNPTTSCQTLSISSKNLYAKQLQLILDGNSNTGDTSVTFGKTKPSLWVALGSGINTMAYSSDGINWNGLGNILFTEGRSLGYNGRIWVAGGTGPNTLAYSYDGLNWTGLGKTIFNTGVYDFAWNGTLWVAAGEDTTNTIAYSYDGIQWVGRGKTINTRVASVGWNGKMFVAVGSRTGTASETANMIYSYDGINWTTNQSTLFLKGSCVRWNGTLWVVGASDTSSSNYMVYSSDGITWTSVINSKTIINHSNGILGLAWNGTLWVGVGGGTGGTNSIVYSYDGILWNGVGTSIFSTGYSVAWNGQMFVACGTGTNSMAYSYDGITWTGLGTLFTICYSAINNVAYENSITLRERLMVAGGRGTNTLAYSYDGITWKGLGNTVFNGGCYDVAWNGTIWVAMGYSNTSFAYSYDGINWTANTAYNSVLSLGSWVEWNGTQWIAGGYPGSATLAYSYNGIQWTGIEKTTFTEYCMGIATNGKRWVAIGKGANSIAYSDDGLNWTGLGTTLFTDGITVACNGPMFLAGGNGSHSLAYSYDGQTWVGLGTSLVSCHGLDWNGTMWVVIGGDGSMGTAHYSYDGKTWTRVSLPWFTYGMYVNWNGSLWIGVGLASVFGTVATAIAGKNTMAYSIDGIQWFPLGKDVIDADGIGIGSDLLRDNVSVEPTRVHVACGYGTNTLAYSYDGIKWNGLGKGIFTDQCLTVASNGNLWVAGGKGTSNTLAYSYNGIDWIGLGTTIFPTVSGYCNTVSTNGKIWLAGGTASTGSHTIAYSYDGINWTGLGKTTFINSTTCFAWNGTIWVASGYTTGNQLAYSYDGIIWVACENTPFDGVCDSVVWSGTKFVASGGGGITMNSTNGISWSSGNKISVRGQWIAHNGTFFIIVGGNSKVFHSPDGSIWTEKTNTISSGTVRGIIWTGKLWLLFAETNSNIPYSYDGITWINNTGSFTGTICGTVGLIQPQGYASPSDNSIQLYQPIVAGGEGSNTLAYSMDGITWTGLGKAIFDNSGVVVRYNGSMWVAGGKGVNTLAYSYDGIQWTGLGNQLFNDTCLTLYYNKLWYAGGISSNTMAYSYDGFNWTNMAQGLITTGCYTIVSNGSIWLAGGQGTNTMVYSSNGLNWTANSNTPFSEVCYGIAWNGTVWVAVGNGINVNGSIVNGTAYSYDGLNWSRATSLITRGRSVVWNGYIFAVIGDPNNVISFSRDGILWNSTTFSPFNGETKSVIWTGDKWIIFSAGPSMKYSYDGKTWINTNSTVFTTAMGGAVSDGRLSDTLHLVTDAYYQTGYKTLTFATNQTG
jgi:hypothetical protein